MSKVERDRVNSNLRELQKMVEHHISCHEMKIPREYRAVWRQMVKDKVSFSFLGPDQHARSPSSSDVLQIILSSIANFHSIDELSIYPTIRGPDCREVENENSGEDESATVVKNFGSGQTSEFCEIDNMFGQFKNLHLSGSLGEE